MVYQFEFNFSEEIAEETSEERLEIVDELCHAHVRLETFWKEHNLANEFLI